MSAVVGIDGGTESLRAIVFDTATGAQLGSASSAYVTTFPSPGRAEQSPTDWWAAIGEAVREAIKNAGIDAAAVAGLAARRGSYINILYK